MALRRRLSALFLLVVAASVLSYPSQASAQSDADWPTYHKDLPRTGVAAGPAGSANIELRWQSPTRSYCSAYGTGTRFGSPRTGAVGPIELVSCADFS